MSEIKYEIIENIGVFSKAGSGWAKELNLISWNDREPKYPLRRSLSSACRRGTSPKYDIGTLNDYWAFTCRIWGRLGAFRGRFLAAKAQGERHPKRSGVG